MAVRKMHDEISVRRQAAGTLQVKHKWYRYCTGN